MAVRHALREVDGVVEAVVSYDDKRADVRYRPDAVTLDALVKAVDEVGFRASVIAPDDAASDGAP